MRSRLSLTEQLSLVNKMFIIWQKQEQFNVSFSCVALTEILIANGDEPNLILPKFAVPLCFFFSSALWHLELDIVR